MTSIRVSDETLLRMDIKRPEIAIRLRKVLKSNDEVINALLDFFESNP